MLASRSYGETCGSAAACRRFSFVYNFLPRLKGVGEREKRNSSEKREQAPALPRALRRMPVVREGVLCRKKEKAPIEVPDLVGTDSGRLSLPTKKASSAKPGRTFQQSQIYQNVIALSSKK